MKIKLEKNIFKNANTSTQELLLDAYDFGHNFNIKRFTSFIHYGTKLVKVNGFKAIDENNFYYQPLGETLALSVVLIPEWADGKRWLFILKLSQVAEDIEIDNLRVSEFAEWLKGEHVASAMDCTVILNGANTGRSLNTLFEQNRVQ